MINILNIRFRKINLQNFSKNQKSIPWTFPLTLKNSKLTNKLTSYLKK